MLHSNAVKLTEFLFSKCPIEAVKRPIFVYGFELALSTFSSFLSIILISVLLGDILSSLLFIAVFFFLRLYAGGFHASTYTRCFIITNFVFLAVVTISFLLERYSSKPIVVILGILSGGVIYSLAPIHNIKHPLSPTYYEKNRKMAHILVTLEVLVFLIMGYIKRDMHYLTIFAASLAAVAVMMIIPKIEERRG